MTVAETKSFQIGPYTVQQRPRFDNPAFAVYIVSRDQKMVGKSFSYPDLGCCEWLERERGVYAESSCSSTALYRERVRAAERGRASYRKRAGRPRKGEAERELAEAIES